MLRLTPRERSILRDARRRERKGSMMSHLDCASNLRHLRDEAGDGTNFRANVHTMKQLFFGTKDINGVAVASSKQLQVLPGGGGGGGNIDWERAPS